jgi:NADH:ubiquinone oxidoreductase subunit C
MYSAQLADIFSYEVPRGKFSTPNNTGDNSGHKYSAQFKGATSVVVYNFHILNTQERLYLFLSSDTEVPTPLNVFKKSARIASITELFFAANWLERELSELSGVIVKDKKDLRNLMLQYGDSSAPFQKSFPSIGLKEMFYNPIKDTIVQNPVSLQL